MASNVEIQQQILVLHDLRTTLNHYERQAARYGGEDLCPPQTIHGLTESRQKIGAIEEWLRRLGVSPDSEPDGDKGVDFLTAPSPLHVVIPPPPEPRQPPNTERLIGRVAEIEAYDIQLKRNHATVITGMPGIGKTSLAALLAQRHSERKKVFWRPQADRDISGLVHSLAGFAAYHGKKQLWEQLESARLSKSQAPTLGTQIDYLSPLLAGQGFLLVFDDFTYNQRTAEPDFVQLVESLIRLIEQGEISLIATTRTKPRGIPLSYVINLVSLGEAEVRAMLDRSGLYLSDEDFAQVYRQTNGNSQLVVLAIDALKQTKNQPLLIADLSASSKIEDYLLTVINVNHLSPSERTIMHALSLLFSYGGTQGLLEEIVAADDIRSDIYALADRNLLSISEGPDGEEYRLHEIIQRFFSKDPDRPKNRPERARIHRAAATYYAEREHKQFRAALHWEAADNPGRAIELIDGNIISFINAGRIQPLRELIERIAQRFATNKKGQILEPEHQAMLNLARGELYTFLQLRDQANTYFQHALEIFMAIQPADANTKRQKARACRGMAELLQSDAPQEARAWAQRGLAELDGSDALEQARLYRRLGASFFYTGELAEAQQALDQCLALLPADEQAIRADALSTLGVIQVMQGNLQVSRLLLEEALLHYTQIYDYQGQAHALQNLSQICHIEGDWEIASTYCQQGLTIAQNIGDTVRRIELGNTLGILQARRGEIDSAAETFERSLILARHAQNRESIVYLQASRADLLLHIGDLDGMEAALQEAEQLARELEVRAQLSEIYRNHALLWLQRGDMDIALSSAERACMAAITIEDPLAEGISLRVLGQVQYAVTRTTEALESFERSLVLLTAEPYEAALTRREWGIVLHYQNKRTAAAALLREAKETFTRLKAWRDIEQLPEYR